MAVKTVQVTLNGQTYTLTKNASTGKYEATITAPNATSWGEQNNKYGITAVAEDDAGNITTKDRGDSTLGANLQIRVLEKTKPTVTLISPSSGARVITSKPTIEFKVRDSGSGINISSLQLKIDNGAAIGNTAAGMTCTSVSGGYNCSYIPATALSEGAHTITIVISDNDGNISDTLSSGFNVDTVPPALNISNPANGLITNNKNLTLTGTTNDLTSSPVTVSIKLNGIDQGAVTIGSGGSFSKALILTEGNNNIEVKAVDSAGLTSTVTRTVIVDTIAPTITSVTLSASTVDAGKTFTITVEVTD